jgi:hypothetical protein
LLLEKIPLLVLAIGSAIARTLAQHDALSTVEKVPLSWRISNALALSEDLQHNIANYRNQLPLRDPGVSIR